MTLAELEALDEEDKPEMKLLGHNGNVYSIIGRCHTALRKAGWSHLIEPFTEEMRSGDYDHALQTVMRYFNWF